MVKWRKDKMQTKGNPNAILFYLWWTRTNSVPAGGGGGAGEKRVWFHFENIVMVDAQTLDLKCILRWFVFLVKVVLLKKKQFRKLVYLKNELTMHVEIVAVIVKIVTSVINIQGCVLEKKNMDILCTKFVTNSFLNSCKKTRFFPKWLALQAPRSMSIYSSHS
jgi:hypothetical protein